MQNLSNKSEGRNEKEKFSGLSLFFKRLIICFFKFVSKYVEKYGVKITIQSEATDKESVKIGKNNTGIERKKKEMEGKRIERLVEERLENDILIEKAIESLRDYTTTIEEKIEKREDYLYEKSDKWQESDKGQEYYDKTEEWKNYLEEIESKIDDLENTILELQELEKPE